MNEAILWEAEASVIGGMLIDFPRCKDALLELMPSEFYSDDMQLAFERIKAINDRGDQVDFVTVLSEMGDTAEYRMSLKQAAAMVPSLGSYASYINIVKNEAQRRRLVDQMQEMVFYRHSGSEILAQLRQIVENEQSQDTAYHEDMMLYKLGEYRGKLYDGAKTEKTKTGYSDLDHLLGGLAPKNFTVIGARPAMGKTAFAGCLAINLVESGRKVDFFSIEMSNDQLFDRLGANKQSIDHNRLRDGKTTAQENETIMKSLVNLTENRNFYLFDDEVMCMRSLVHMNALSLYSGGCDGLSLAAGWVGIETIGFCECDAACREQLRRRHPAKPIFHYDTLFTLHPGF